ncbi:MAG: hypothetical protein Q7U88_07080 [Desulfocapsaceae bacterium]|nr:hypothetical protein [Desulfocapsaceae bacterium]
MTNLKNRVMILEQRIHAVEVPQSTRVFFDGDHELQEYQKIHPERDVCIINTVCARRCSADCSDRSARQCRI